MIGILQAVASYCFWFFAAAVTIALALIGARVLYGVIAVMLRRK